MEAPLLLIRMIGALFGVVYWTVKRYPGWVLLALAVWLLATGGKGW